MQLVFKSNKVPTEVLCQALLPATVDSVQQDVDAVVAAYVNETSGTEMKLPRSG